MKKAPVSKSLSTDQLHLMFDREAGQAATEHFVYSITYECVNRWHDKCKGSKCYCLCHYRCNRAGNYVKIKKAEAKAEAEKREQEAWEATLSAGGLLPGEAEMSDVPTSVTEGDKPKGFKCHTCFEYHEFDAYVMARWKERLVHVCTCGSKHVIRCGSVTMIKGPRKGWVPF
jgi:hypothetical protein